MNQAALADNSGQLTRQLQSTCGFLVAVAWKKYLPQIRGNSFEAGFKRFLPGNALGCHSVGPLGLKTGRASRLI